jgi:tetratricopeptide (TPR) repeat protein
MKNKRTRTTFSRLILSLIAAVAIAAPVFADDSYLQAGIEKFNSQQYEAARREFKRLLPEHPTDGLLEYYLASSLAKLNRMQKASVHFRQAYLLSPANSSVREMSEAALTAYGLRPGTAVSPAAQAPSPPLSMQQAPLSTSHVSKASGPDSTRLSAPSQSFNGGAGSASVGLRQDTQNFSIPGTKLSGSGRRGPHSLGFGHGISVKNYPTSASSSSVFAQPNSNSSGGLWTASGGQNLPTIHSAALLAPGGTSGGNAFDSPMAAQRALDQIEQQTANQKYLLNHSLNPKSESAAQEADAIAKATDKQIQKMMTPVAHGRRGTYSNYSQDDIDRVQAAADSRIAELKRLNNEATSVQERTRLIEESAANLKQQVTEQHLTGSGIRLMPLGTNLNVRNYETYHSDDDDRAAIPTLEAKPLKLGDVEKAPAKHSADSASRN